MREPYCTVFPGTRKRILKPDKNCSRSRKSIPRNPVVCNQVYLNNVPSTTSSGLRNQALQYPRELSWLAFLRILT